MFLIPLGYFKGSLPTPLMIMGPALASVTVVNINTKPEDPLSVLRFLLSPLAH